MYGSFETWQQASPTALRIFDPFAYHATLHARRIPIALGEAAALCGRYPLLWQRNALGALELIALRGITKGAEIAQVRRQPHKALPLLLQAYPLRFEDPNAPGLPGLDHIAAMEARDQGAYLLDEKGNPSPGAQLKLAALEAFSANHHLRSALTEAAFFHDQVEPVWLPPALVTAEELPEFYVLRAFPDDHCLLSQIPRADWPKLARFMVAQRASLQMMANLIAWAETQAPPPAGKKGREGGSHVAP